MRKKDKHLCRCVEEVYISFLSDSRTTARSHELVQMKQRGLQTPESTHKYNMYTVQLNFTTSAFSPLLKLGHYGQIKM